MAAMDAMAALKRFAQWCILRRWWWYEEFSWVATLGIGAVQANLPEVSRWARHVFKAFLNGCWFVYWTEETLYWVAKPALTFDTERRLHNAKGAALTCAVDDLYFWHGVLVPASVILQPETITIEGIQQEQNAEVRRVLLTRFGGKDNFADGFGLYMLRSGARQVETRRHWETDYVLLEAQFDGQPYKAVKMECPSTKAGYVIAVPPEVSGLSEAMNWIKNVPKGKDYFSLCQQQT